MNIFLDPETKRLRAGWRALIFGVVVALPRFALLLVPARPSAGGGSQSTVDASLGTLFVYILLVGWVLLVSFACLRWLERLPLSSLGYDSREGWWREILTGCAISALMVTAVVGIQSAGGGTRISLNPASFKTIAAGVALAFAVLILAGAFEELLFRGYAFQTLLRGVRAWVPILILSVFFGAAHWSNPDRTLVSTANTVLAGIWLAAAYLRTRGLWFPTALHFAWNWMMGAFYGLPVSGLTIVREPLLHSTSGSPVWLTGGAYGCEGGIASTVVLAIAVILFGVRRPVAALEHIDAP
jgi:uncharacterized protein